VNNQNNINYYDSRIILQKNNAISRNALDRILKNERQHSYHKFESNGFICPVSQTQLKYIQVQGITHFWEENTKFDISQIISDMLCGFNKDDLGFAFIMKGDQQGITICLGIDDWAIDSLKSSLISLFPNISIKDIHIQTVVPSRLTDAGVFTGIPTNKLLKEDNVKYQLDRLCQGMMGKEFIYAVFSTGIHPNEVNQWYMELLEEMSMTYEYQKSGLNENGTSIDKQSFVHTRYFENLEDLEKTYHTGIERGMWYYTGYFGINDTNNSEYFGNLIKSTFSGDESSPDKMRTMYTVEAEAIRELILDGEMLLNSMPDATSHPLGEKAAYMYQTIVNSNQLAVMTSLPIKEYPGYYIDNYVEFDLSNRPHHEIKEPIFIGDIVRVGHAGVLNLQNKYAIEKNDYTRHCLIIGVTGGGKTNTSKSLLRSLWCEKDIPFLVIESAKREYWELRNLENFEDLMIYTLGSEDPEKSVRYRLNPFETLPGISLQSHIDLLLATFKTAFEMYPPMPYVLEKAVYDVYKDRGWDIVTGKNTLGLTLYPTLSDLYDKVGYVVQNMGYDSEVSSNIKSALEARINSLMIGGKGAMLNTATSIPIDSLLSYPTVLELEDIGDDETKSFVIGMLLVQLYEYRKCQKDRINGAKQLQHVLMVEEAHRLLKNVSEQANSSQAKSVEFFCNMLAEIRTYGQGIFIADQIPTKLASDTIKNTNLKIVHRTVAKEDREAMGRAMNMTNAQIDYLSSLPRGFAAVYSEGDNRPKCVKFPLVEDAYHLSRQEVIRPIQQKVNHELINDFEAIHAGCAYCEQKCQHHKAIEILLSRVSVEDLKDRLQKSQYSVSTIYQLFNFLMENRLLESGKMFNQICLLGHILNETQLDQGTIKTLIARYMQYKVKKDK